MIKSGWILAIILPAFFALLIILRISFRRLAKQRDEMSSLADASDAFARAPADPEEIAEIAFLEIARMFETDFFHLGIFENEIYRTVLIVRDGNREENIELELGADNQGLIGEIRSNGRPRLVSDYATDDVSLPFDPGFHGDDPPRSGAYVPLLVEDKVIGILCVQNRRKGTFTKEHLHPLSILANAIAASLATIGIQTEIEFRTLQLVLIQEVSRRLISLQPLSERLSQVSALILQAFEYAQVRLYEIQDGDLHLCASALQEYPDIVSRTAGDNDLDLTRRAAEEGLTLLDTVQPDIENHGAEDNSYMQLVVPIRVEDRVLGVMQIESRLEEAISPEEIGMAEMLAAQVAIAMLEARNSIQQQEETWITTVLLEAARHAAQPGDAEPALQAVLQLIILLTGMNWAILLLSDDDAASLRVGPTAGLKRQQQERVRSLQVPTQSLRIEPPYTEDVELQQINLPRRLADLLGGDEATALILSDGFTLLGALILEGQGIEGRRISLLTGIAHQISLRLENTRLIDEAASRQSFERELAMARDIQSSFLPDSLPTHPGWEIGATWGMAREVGGDFYDFIPLPPGADGPRWGIVIADVADKGIPAALYMALCRTLVRSVAVMRASPGETLTRVNQLLFADTRAELFISVFYAIWEPEPARVTYANAGHNPPLLLEPETPPHRLDQHGMVLGVRETEEYNSYELSLTPGQLLVLYTDGVTEAVGAHGEFFGIHRLENLVLGTQEWHAQSVADLIARRVSMFSGSQELHDDLTAIVLQHQHTVRDG